MLTHCQSTLFSRFKGLVQAKSILSVALLGAVLALSACGTSGKASYPQSTEDATASKHGRIQENFDGDNGFTLWDSGNKRKGGAGVGAMAVNGYLWRAALDTIDFMPIASSDSNGGVILTDWYTPPATPNERLKLNILIKDQTLRADGVKVTVFRQIQDGRNNWRDTTVSPDTAIQLEDTIVARARQLRLQNEGKAN